MKLRSRAWLKRLATSNFVAALPRVVRALLLARSNAFDWRQVAAATHSRGALQAAYRVLGCVEACRLLNPLFDAAWYMARYGLKGHPADAFIHYLLIGDRLGLQPHPWFDPRFVRHFHRLRPWTGALGWYSGQVGAGAVGHPLFDPSWYIEQYSDVARSGSDPLFHFVLHGQAEGRSPNPFFDSAWYLARNPDVATSGLPPALHFVLYGSAELRDPGPAFSAKHYCESGADRRLPDGRELSPLAHYLAVGRAAGIALASRALSVDELCREATQRVFTDGVVDVVLPVYRGLEETRACLDSVLAARNVKRLRLRIHNDASPEPEVTQYLRDVCDSRPDIRLVENPTNLGFVRTVNQGMRDAMAEPDFESVILLNSDTVVAADWIDRLAAHAAVDTKVATVTALSNNATICSYPHLGANAMPPATDTAGVHAAAAINGGWAIDVPTGVGFCMLITRAALDALGFFDEDAFGRGYGEENDFCLRAAEAGFSNKLALDVFVQHVGEVSFADVSKPGKLVAEGVIRARYPDYARKVAEFCARDPGMLARVRITLALWRSGGRPVHVLFTHAVGGGTERHVQERAAYLRTHAHVVVVRPAHRNGDAIRLQNDDPFDSFDLELEGVDARGLARVLHTLGGSRIEIHHVLGFGPFLREGIALSGLAYDFVVHDYFTICPQITLSSVEGTYCGEPDQHGCNACIACRPSHGASDIWNWRVGHAWLVEGAENVRAPSFDAARRIQHYFGRNVTVLPHEPDLPRAATRRAPRKQAGLPVVAVLGTLAPHKGRGLVLETAAQAHRTRAGFRIHLIGDPQGEVPAAALGRFSWTGRYEEGRLEQLIEDAQASAILFASPIPETYSYTLTAAMKSGLPIVATAIGAFPERLAHYHDALLVPPDIGAVALVSALDSFLARRAQVEARA